MSMTQPLPVSPSAPPRERNWWVYVILLLVSFVALVPIVWIVLTALMDRAVAQSVPPQWIFTPTLEAFETLLTRYDMLLYMRNSAIVSVSATFFSVVLGMFCAYALARYEFPGKNDVAFWILSNRMLPPVAVILPIFMFFQTFKLLDSLVGLILLYTGMQLPFVVWMLKGFFEDIPRQIEESALVDGDTWFGAFRRVTLPLMAPSITATAIFVLILSWNEYAFAVFLTGAQTRTLPPAVASFIGGSDIQWNLLGAACVFITLPILLFVVAVQRQFVRGLSMGMMK
ncbi:carbohydrate ABC transporter permease [Chelativorans sp.]|uniref:carbohydrate ABC transporter permease n=1 Tax=Chelativorans sp. TaxID=2203393 RepID=UPI0028117EEA|nr:carbohydrate ABC transporter permease [Chelativorans sp.]